MAWVFNTWTEWIDSNGRTWKVIVAAGALTGSGLLYWYERPEPNYPQAQDETVILAATQEREMVDAGGFASNAAPVLTLRALAGTSDVATNAVLYYPSGYNPYGVYGADGSDPTHGTLARCAWLTKAILDGADWVDMRPGQPWVNDLAGFADNQVSWGDLFSHLVGPAWWTNFYGGVWFDGYDDGQPWTFMTNKPPYVTQRPYTEIAKALSVMRADARVGRLLHYVAYTKTGNGLDQTSWELANAVAVQDLMTAPVVTNYFSPAVGMGFPGEYIETHNWADDMGGGVTNYHQQIHERVIGSTWGYEFNGRTNGLDRVWLTVQGIRYGYTEWWEPTLTLVEGVPTMLWYGTIADMVRTNIADTVWHAWTRPTPAWDWDVPAVTNEGDWSEGWLLDSGHVGAGDDILFTTQYDFRFLTNAAAFWQ